MTSEPSRCGLADLPAPDVPLAATTTTSGSTSPAASAGAMARGTHVGEQPGTAIRRASLSSSRWPGSSGSPYGHEPAHSLPPPCPPLPYHRAQAAGSSSRWSAPQSMTRTSSGSRAATAADSPCGRASTTTSYPPRSSGADGPTSRSANGSRCGCSSPSRRPALALACTPVSRRFGCPASSRHTSPPAYPVAPVTPTVHVCPSVTMHDHTALCMTVQQRGFAAPRATSFPGRTDRFMIVRSNSGGPQGSPRGWRMDPTRRAAMAAELADVLPALDLTADGPLALLDAPGNGGVGHRDADLHLALLVETRDLLDGNEALRQSVDPAAASPADADRLRRLTEQALEHADGHRAEALWALLGGEAAPPTSGGTRPGRWHRMRTALFSEGLLARSVAGLWMNVLVLGTVAVVVATLWGGFSLGTDHRTLALALLKLFALWCLSFLPGWLYVRFLGQRAGALWNEFVVHLHRLGMDEPCFLPRPPAASALFREWLVSGGPLYSQRHNLYRQKFDAYYGKAVVDGVEGTNFSVRVDTMFPVFLATAVLAVGWTTVLWDPAFLLHPSSLWDMLRFAFLGAYCFIVQSLIRRFFQSDLRPSAYAAAVLRVIVVLLVMTALHQVVQVHGKSEAAVAFVVGVFPTVALQALLRFVATTLRVVVPQLSPDYPLNQLDGLNIWYEARLVEEGVEDMQNLAT